MTSPGESQGLGQVSDSLSSPTEQQPPRSLSSLFLSLALPHFVSSLLSPQSRGMDLVEILSFLFQLSFSTLGKVRRKIRRAYGEADGRSEHRTTRGGERREGWQ